MTGDALHWYDREARAVVPGISKSNLAKPGEPGFVGSVQETSP